MLSDNDICYFARINFRTRKEIFGVYKSDRYQHTYILGKTGSGKTNLLDTMINQDISGNNGFCLIDVHGDLVTKIHQNIPVKRKDDAVYMDVTNANLQLGYNPLRKVSFEKRSLVVSNILETFERLSGSQGWGVKMAHILRNILLGLLDQPSANFTDVLKILHDQSFRQKCIPNIINSEVKVFWQKEFKSYTKNDLIPIYNKLGTFLSYPSVKRILVDNSKQISLRSIMDEGKILLVNLAKGAIGSDASYILGSLLLSSLSAAAFSRIDIPEHSRKPFFIYLDEFQNYTNLSVVDMLSELRKFKLGIIMAHQYMAQLDSQIRDAILGNVGTIICFRLGYQDAKLMEKEMYPYFEAIDFINLANYEIYLRLMIDGRSSKPFSATTILANSLSA